jgi:hypothetical protein
VLAHVLVALALVVLVVLAALACLESFRLLKEAERAGGLAEKLELWLKSALYMLLFAVLALMLVATLALIYYSLAYYERCKHACQV